VLRLNRFKLYIYVLCNMQNKRLEKIKSVSHKILLLKSSCLNVGGSSRCRYDVERKVTCTNNNETDAGDTSAAAVVAVVAHHLCV